MKKSLSTLFSSAQLVGTNKGLLYFLEQREMLGNEENVLWEG